jgi:hypothetical protein
MMLLWILAGLVAGCAGLVPLLRWAQRFCVVYPRPRVVAVRREAGLAGIRAGRTARLQDEERKGRPSKAVGSSARR